MDLRDSETSGPRPSCVSYFSSSLQGAQHVNVAIICSRIAPDATESLCRPHRRHRLPPSSPPPPAAFRSCHSCRSCSHASTATAAHGAPPTSAASLAGCLQAHDITTITALDQSYYSARKVFSKLYSSWPSAIAYPSSTDEVAAAVRCARAFRTTVRPRCGGHGNEGGCRGEMQP